MGPRAPPSPAPGLLHRRYSVPETVMRRYRLARELSDVEAESLPASGPATAPRDLVRRSALLRRMGGASALSPCRCDTRSLDGSRLEMCPPLVRGIRSSEYMIQPPPDHPHPVPATNENHFIPLPSADLLEIVVSETSPAVLSRPSRIASNTTRSSDCNLNIDEYVSNILVDSLNSLTDRLESMTVSIGGGDGRISVVEKEIKVKLQNKAVNTVVHLSPTSNNQIIFGNRELCERDALNVSFVPAERLFSDEFQVDAEGWNVPPRTESPCASLVDSLDDPMSPRVVPPPPPPPLPPPQQQPVQPSPLPLDIQEPSQSTPMSSAYTDMEYSPLREKCESFFIRMNEDNCACEKENIIVADHMPEKIKQRLYRRHRRREIRAQGARRGAVRRNTQRDIQRQCAALVDALIDDAIAKIAREEYRYTRIARHREFSTPKENALTTRMWNGRSNNLKGTKDQRLREELKPTSSIAPVPAPPPPASHERVPPRRLYHKSEIHDGGKCIEILEIVEYANTPRSSSETNSDESPNATKCRKSRIPVPILDRTEQPRIRRDSITSSTSSVTGSNVIPRRASVPGAELCTSSRSMRFERVFDVIPEERSSLSLESASEDMRAPPTAPPSRRSAATSPRAPPGSTGGSVGRVQSQKDRGHGRRSIGTQWTRTPLLATQNSSDHKSGVESELPEEEEQSSSECEFESVCEVPPRPRPQSARRRPRLAQRLRRRALRPAPPPPPPPPPIHDENAAHNVPESNSDKVHSDGGDGWSLTLAGSCRAALPSRVDLRLRFPSRAGAAAPPATSSRSDAATDRFSDAGSQEREWLMCKRPAAMHCTHAAPAIRYNSTADSLPVPVTDRARALRGRNSEVDSRGRDSAGSCARARPKARAVPEVLPALDELLLRRPDVQARGARCRCWASADTAPAQAQAPAGARRARASPAATPRVRRKPPASPDSPATRPPLDGLHQAALLTTRRDVGEMKATAAALAVLGCAIVPERRAAPPTASQRDLLRARRAARAPRAPRAPRTPRAPRAPRAPRDRALATRRHSYATTATIDSSIHCLCYSYT